jgi:hypothetical protein
LNHTLAGVIALTGFAASSAPAQTCTHALVGRVTDQTGQPVPGALVMVTEQKVHVQADSTGRYRLCGLAIGQHTVSAGYLGMMRQLLRVSVSGSQDDTLDIHMARTPECWRDPMLDTGLLAASEARWTRFGLQSYSFVVTEFYYGPGSDIPWQFTVRNDSVVAATEVNHWKPSDSIPFGHTHVRHDLNHFAVHTPPQLFERLHRLATDSSKSTAVTYDSRLGYPTVLSESVNCALDAGGTIRLERLRPRGN